MEKKKCPKCKIVKDVATEFGRNKNEKKGIAIFCKSCFNRLNLESKKRNNPNYSTRRGRKPKTEEEKAKNKKDGKRLSKFKITPEEYELMLFKQNKSCKICKSEFGQHKRIYIDHCHSQGHVRGLLCINCNLALGHIKDNVTTLKKMITYLSK